jgi:quinol monooxygenase YgiN
MLLITGTFRIPPERLAEARPAMAAMIAASRAEAGCLDYSYAEDLLEPGLIRVTDRTSGKT